MVGKSGLNFNYEGPPVTVSNGMALDLVTQFGMQNAWFAILKLTGINVKEESEKAKALKHFRNKIQRIKKNVANLKTRPDEFNKFLNKEFNQNFIIESNHSQVNINNDTNAKAKILQDEEPKTIDERTSSIPSTSATVALTIKDNNSESMSNSQLTDVASTSTINKTTDGDKLQPKNSTNTIDDVVSSIMHKIQNNEPFEGEKIVNSNQGRPLKKAYKSTTKANLKSPVTTASTSTSLINTSIIPTTTSALFIPDQVTILSNFNQIIRDTLSPAQVSSSVTKIITQQPVINPQITQIPLSSPAAPFSVGASTFTLPNISNNVTVQALLQSFQKQAKTAQQPFHINLATLQQQIQQQFQQQDIPETSNNQEISLNNESSNNVLTVKETEENKLKKREMTTKKKLANGGTETDESQKKKKKMAAEVISSSSPLISNQADTPKPNKTEENVEDNEAVAPAEPKRKVGRKPLNKTPMTTTVVKNDANKSNDENLKRISELESQLTKLRKQLNAEKNKFNIQKKKLEKAQSDLEKSMDAIQIVQIDLSCQKADNNNLIAENIALKAENQHFRTKESSKNQKEILPPKNSKSDVVKRRGRPGLKPSNKPKELTKSPQNDDSTKRGSKRSAAPKPSEQAEIVGLVEYGRRQSKRVTIPRSTYLFMGGY